MLCTTWIEEVTLLWKDWFVFININIERETIRGIKTVNIDNMTSTNKYNKNLRIYLLYEHDNPLESTTDNLKINLPKVFFPRFKINRFLKNIDSPRHAICLYTICFFVF